MRVVIVGAGAVGGVVGGFLARSGQDVAFVARGAHAARMTSHGLTVRTRDDTFVVRVPVATTAAELGMTPDDVVLLAVKGQDTAAALDSMAEATGPSTPVVCLQNGVTNEAAAAERFLHVYGVPVMAPTVHLEPGVVQAKAGPVPAILDVGRYPAGVDATATALAAAFTTAGMVSEARADVMRWKWAKLLMNLGNAVEVVCGRSPANRPVHDAVVAEGNAVLDAAGIDRVGPEEFRARRGDLLRTAAASDAGGSSWQSAVRGRPVETDHLTGEVVRLGRSHGVPTPVNEVLLRRALARSAAGEGPGDTPARVILMEAAALDHT